MEGIMRGQYQYNTLGNKKIIPVVLLLLFFAIFPANAQCKNDTILYWTESRKLEWDDFRGKVPIECGKDKARSHLSIEIVYQTKNGEVKNVLVPCTFLKNSSWTKDTSLLVLEHEQIHFDIAEVYARKLRKAVSFLKEQDEEELKVYDDTITSLLKEHRKRQDDYDNETNHSINKGQQENWNRQIAKELEELKEYEVDYPEYIEE